MKKKLLLLKSLFMFVLMMPILLIVGGGGLKELTEKLAAKGKIISQIYDEAGEDLDFSKVKCLEGDTTAKVEALKAIDAEVTDLREERVKLLDIERALKAGRELNEEMNQPAQEMRHPAKGAEGKAEIKTLGELFVEKKVGYELKGREVHLPDIDLKTVMSAGAGWDPPTIRESRVEVYPVAPIGVIDHIPMLTTQRDTIKYMKETTFTNNAAEVLESVQGTLQTYGEGALALTEQSDEVEKIAVWLPVTDEQLEDVAGIAAYINSRLTYMIRARLDGQILVGTGRSVGTPDLVGTLDLASLLTQAKGNDPVPDAIYKAMTQVRVTGFAEPSVVFIHPNDWQAVRLLTTADGIYLFGSPMEAGPSRIWGVPVTQTTRVTENTGIVGDYRGYSNLYIRRGVTLKVSDSHASYFIQGVQAIKAEMRCSMVHYRDTAFCSVTSI